MLRTAIEQASCLLKGIRLGPEVYHQQIRGTAVLRRIHPPALRKEGEKLPLKEEEYQYSLVEHLASRPWGNMQVVLAHDVEGLGIKGDIVTVKKRVARNKLLPSGLAVYASPENIAQYEELLKNEPKKPRQSVWAQKTVRALQVMNLKVPMNPHTSWIVNKTHIRVAFRRAGVELSENCFSLPQEPITETGEYKIKVVVNKLDEVMVNTIVYHHYDSPKDAPGGVWPPVLPPTFGKSKVDVKIPSELQNE